MRLGYKLMSEELGPRALVSNAIRAEQVGFDLAAISDHYFPWLEEEGHAPFIWTVLGAIATATEQIDLMTAVTCPTFRYHPAIVAQAATTVALLAGRRFRLGLGSGERLNEHVVGWGWPAASVRQERLEEAIDVIRLLFAGGTHSHRGTHFALDHAKIFDMPDEPPEILMAAGGPRAARIAGEKADGIIATEPRREIVDAFRDAGGRGPRCAEIGVCWADRDDDALDTMHRYARWSKLDWKVLPELPTPSAFDAVTKGVDRSDLAEIPHGPEVERYVDAIEPYLDAGFDELILHQIGPEQDGFLKFFERELAPALRILDEGRSLDAQARNARRSRPARSYMPYNEIRGFNDFRDEFRDDFRDDIRKNLREPHFGDSDRGKPESDAELQDAELPDPDFRDPAAPEPVSPDAGLPILEIRDPFQNEPIQERRDEPRDRSQLSRLARRARRRRGRY